MDSKVKLSLICSCKIVQYSLFRKLALLSPNHTEKYQNEYNFVIITPEPITFGKVSLLLDVGLSHCLVYFNSNQPH